MRRTIYSDNTPTISLFYDALGRQTEAHDAAGVTTFLYDSFGSLTKSYGYNEKSELTNAVAAVDSDYRYAFDFDDIGNRISSFDLGTNRTYIANNLNQYTQISNLCDSASLREEFLPQFDDDGNQTLVKTATGICSVTYNGENRPILWQCVSTNSLSPNSSTPPLFFTLP